MTRQPAWWLVLVVSVTGCSQESPRGTGANDAVSERWPDTGGPARPDGEAGVAGRPDGEPTVGRDRGDGSFRPERDGGGTPAVCQGVSCSGKGACVAVDGAPTCDCPSGTYPVGLGCLDDPCENGGTCFYVDPAGDDGKAGSTTAPWKSLARVKQAMPTLKPGSFVLLRRGGDWTKESLQISGVTGAADHPVTFGAYGPPGLGRPRLSKVNLVKSSHVTVRDFEVAVSSVGPCISVSESDHPIVQDTVVHDCASNGILFGGATSHGVMVDNLVYGINQNDALVIHSPMVITASSKVGDHHWILDNRARGPVDEQSVDVATGNDTFEGAKDIKIIGNRLTGAKAGCIMLGHGTSVAWVIGNLLGNCPTAETAAPLSVGGLHGANSGTRFQVRGNVIFWNLMANRVIAEAPRVEEATFEQNTFITAIGKRTVLLTQYPEGKLELNRNIIWTTGSQAHVGFSAGPQASVSSMDHNWYVPGTGTGCSIAGKSFPEWQASSGFDAGSSCGSVPGLALPTQAEVLDFDGWTSPSFLAKFVPDASWPGCAEKIGAFDCSGKQRLEIKPMPGYSDNGGYGWRGPLVVRQRYPIP